MIRTVSPWKTFLVAENNYSIEARNITKRYGPVTAVSGISFEVSRGEIVGFLGPNGAGKTTTMRILCGLAPATSGWAAVHGVPVATRPDEVKRRIGYMPENNPLPEEMRVAEYLLHRARLKEIPRRKARLRAGEVMEICELRRKHQRRVIGTLSKGYRQRVGVADALLSQPQVIIMDEPTLGLDPHQVIHIRELVTSLRSKTTFIISSHILSEIELCCDRVIILNQGRVVAAGPHEVLCREFLGKSIYKLTVRGDLGALPEAIQKISPALVLLPAPPPDASGNYELALEAPADKDYARALMDNLHPHPRFQLCALSRKPPSLEDVFLAATRRSWEETITEDGRETKQEPEKTEQEKPLFIDAPALRPEAEEQNTETGPAAGPEAAGEKS